MSSPNIPSGNKFTAIAVIVPILLLLVIGWLFLRSPRQPLEKQIQNADMEHPAPTTSTNTPVLARVAEAPPSVLTGKATAKQTVHGGKLQNFDARAVGVGQGDVKRAEALAALQKKIPGVDVQFNPITGAPDCIMAKGHFLTGAKSRQGNEYASVQEFVNENAALFGHDASALNDCRMTREDITAHNGMRTVVWQQQVDGIPVYNTILKANLTKDGALVTLGSHFMNDAMAATGMSAPQRAALVARPPVDVKKAVSLAAGNLGEKIAPELAREASQPEGAERKQRFIAPRLSDTSAQLSWLPVSADKAKLAWDVTLMSLRQNAMFRILVDAQTGDVLLRTSLTNDISNASYRVYADPTTKKPFDSPAPMLPGTPTPSGAQGAEVPRNLVTLQAVNLTASPNGWIDDGGTQTLGNNVDAHTDTNADNIADLPRPTSATRSFDFAMDLTQAPSTYKDAAVTHLFYMNNWMHDQLYSLGFTETSGNFQTSNFGRGGLGNDAVQADAQDGSGTNNANMSTPADGGAPRMQMYIFTGPTPDRDGDFDDVVLLHEYTHGLSNRLVGGGVGISALATDGMGEGWSDFYGLALMADPATDPNAVYPGGSYATLNFVSGMTTNYYYGIRRYPYSTDMTKNPLTFRDIDPTQASPHTGIPLSPLFSSSNSNPSEVHNVGEVWCMVLWECRARLITKYGASGNQKILQLVTDAMKISPANPNVLQSRDAIIQADLVSTGGVDTRELWTAFAKRGMGASATAPASSTTTGVVEAFDLPDDLSVTPTTLVSSNGPVGGPFAPAFQTYTLTNTGTTAPLAWTVAAGQPWMSVSPAGGTLAAGASTTVTMAINSAAAALPAGSYNGTVAFTNITSSTALPRPVKLTAGSSDYFTELFTSANDTDNQSWLFTPNASQNFYGVQRTVVAAFPTSPTGGTSIGLSDDSFSQVTLTGGATVKLYGTSYSSFYIGSNGYITFGSSDTGYEESLAAHFAKPRISALFDDLDPGSGGTISWRQLADRVAVTYQNVPQYGTGDSNNFQIEMFFDGSIRITCLAIGATDGLIGLSQGLGAPGNFVSSNFSAYGTAAQPTLAVTLPATATEGSGVLPAQGAVTLSATQASDTVVTLASSNTGEATVPPTVTVLAGQLSATFDVTIVDDAVLDGPQTVIITATAAGFGGGTGVIAVQDNDGTAALSLSIPATALESAGTVMGTVHVNSAPGSSVTVSLSSNDTTAAQVPSSIVIPAGQTSVNFTITIVNDVMIDGTQNAAITAHVPNWTDGTATISVLDNESANLAISLPSSIAEGTSGTGTVTISGTLSSPLVVSLFSDNTSRLTVPSTVAIATGATSATFTLSAVNNALTDGNASVLISATASGFAGASGATSVLDNDLHHFVISAIASPQTRGVPFNATITAKNINDTTLTNYTATAALSASGTGGAISISPATTTAFTAGVWTGSVTVNTLDPGVVITASDGTGHAGASNVFAVSFGALHHFAWNTQAARALETAVSATITAQDAGNNTVASFGGTVSLSGFTGSGASGSSIVITELNANTPDEIEFMNVGAAPVNISGWNIYIYDNDTGATAPKIFTVPANTSCAAGQIFRLQENGTAPGTFPMFYYGANINWTTGTTDTIGVLIRDGAGNSVDFFCAAGLVSTSVTSPVTIPASQWTGAQVAAPTNASYDYVRIGSADSNNAANWTTGTPSLGTANPGLTIPFPSPSVAVAISPATSGAFSNGVWTGDMTVLQTATQMKFRADDGSGHTGDSNAFDILLTPAVATVAPTAIADTGATLNGTVNANTLSTTVTFEYGINTSYGSTVTATPSPVTGSSNTGVSATIGGLLSHTTYHFRVKGTNTAGTTSGNDLTFTTLPWSPQDWRLHWYGTAANTGTAADSADPYLTGVPNLLVFAHLGPNQNPALATADQLSKPQIIGDDFVLSVTQPAGVNGVTWGAEWRAALTSGSWQPVSDTGSGNVHTFSVPIGDNKKLFMRFKVTSP